ncbi:MAG: 16S rRNA (guanine(527)-N(7))-methyltransferase RsmG [Anaerolineae bacterium]|nr:MAG: 16S rRNA (guanine(527)-N(7))-methyltransferase RsmG [Anaerolineae bacterium]
MENLAREAQRLFGVHLTASQQEAFRVYQRELLRWNQKHNLTAIREPEKIVIRHFLDSLSCALVLPQRPVGRIVDVGTGAGFPGLPLKILYPRLQVTLVESVGKKADFCEHVVSTLKLKDVHVFRGRAESIGRAAEHREAYDWALARAVAYMPVLSEYLLPLVRVGGHVLAMKGETAPAEVQEAENAFRLLGGEVQKLVPVTLPGVVEQHYLVVLDKVAATPQRYPRRVGIPKKRPL